MSRFRCEQHTTTPAHKHKIGRARNQGATTATLRKSPQSGSYYNTYRTLPLRRPDTCIGVALGEPCGGCGFPQGCLGHNLEPKRHLTQNNFYLGRETVSPRLSYLHCSPIRSPFHLGFTISRGPWQVFLTSPGGKHRRDYYY